ncbi:MAG TPA: ribosome maturation factor RimP [Streptosporangiaceae bacterium]
MSAGSRHVAVRPEHLADLIEPVISAAGLELESVRISRAGRRSLLRVVVDGEHGVSLDDIAVVSRAVAAGVDAADAMGPGSYTLEVSSPGVDRPLTEPRHWRRAAGRLVRVPVQGDAIDGTVALAGRVIEAGPSGVLIEAAGERREFGYAELGPGQVQVEFGKFEDDGETPADDGETPAPGGMDLAGDVEPDGH